jgi:hypothetical protein
VRSHPTVCVTGAGAGVDNVREQKKLEARKILVNRADSPASSARFVGRLGELGTSKNVEQDLCVEHNVNRC